MARGRELSQLGSLITVEDSTKNIVFHYSETKNDIFSFSRYLQFLNDTSTRQASQLGRLDGRAGQGWVGGQADGEGEPIYGTKWKTSRTVFSQPFFFLAIELLYLPSPGLPRT